MPAAALAAAVLAFTTPALADDTTASVSTTPASAAETTAARVHFFGTENVGPDGRVRPDRVILSWFSVASMAMAIDGHVVLLDTYIHKGEDRPNYVPTTTDEVAALNPEAIFIGHGHFDHAKTAGEIAARTGAVIVGTPEHCDQATEEGATALPEAAPVRCIEAVDARLGSWRGGAGAQAARRPHRGQRRSSTCTARPSHRTGRGTRRA